MGLGTGCARIILFVFTVCFFILGIAFLAGGIWLLASQDQLFYVLNLINNEVGNEQAGSQIENLASQKGLVSAAAIVMIAVGSFAMIVSFFGCFGAIRESKCLLAVFAILLFVILGTQVAAGVLIFKYKGDVERHASKGLLELQNKYLVSLSDAVYKKQQPQSTVTLLLNYLYVFVDCCGAVNATDAADSNSWRNSNRTWTVGVSMNIPASCCPIAKDKKNAVLARAEWNNIRTLLENENCPVTRTDANNKICVQAINDFIGSYALWIIVGCAVLALSQLLVIIFTVCLICAID